MSNLEGAILSDYLLLECISHGKVADVYRAYQNDTRHYEVAVKIFQPAYAEREAFRAYFMYEAEKIGQFDHPHILPLIEYGEGEKLLYSIAPFVKSGTLDDLLKKVGGKLSTIQTLPIVQQLCAAVQYAHEHDVIHGNIKPANVFVTSDRRMLLADFGIVRGYADSQQSLARLDWGSTEYAAPEQSLGLLRRSSDIYALGTLFFRLLTGSPLFTGQTPVEILLKHVRQPPPSARLLDNSISDAVDIVLQKALRKHSDERYASAAELSHAFTSAVSITPTVAPIPRALNLATRRLTSPLPDPLTPLPATASRTPLPSTLSPASQVTPKITIDLPAELVSATIPSSGLPEQRGVSLLASPGMDVAQMDTQAQEKLPAVYQASPLQPEAETQPAATGAPALMFMQPSTSPQSATGASTERGAARDRDSEREKKRLLLPILIVIFLLIGLLGALLSSFLLPPSPGNSGMRDVPAQVASYVHVTHSRRRELL